MLVLYRNLVISNNIFAVKKIKKNKKLEIRVDFKRWCLDELILAYLIII
jgi:hypothetical protein